MKRFIAFWARIWRLKPSVACQLLVEAQGATRAQSTKASRPALAEVHTEAVVAQGRPTKMANAVAAGIQRPCNLPSHTHANTKSAAATQAFQQEAERHVRPSAYGKDWDEGLPL